MSESKFYICKHCGNQIGMIKDTGVPVICCGEPMHHLEANTTEAAFEKHIPDVKIDGETFCVSVGSVDHPMLPGHYIEWVYLQTDKGGQRIALNPGDAPKAVFALCGAKAIAVYAYCKLHGLWKKDL